MSLRVERFFLGALVVIVLSIRGRYLERLNEQGFLIWFHTQEEFFLNKGVGQDEGDSS